MVSTSSEVLGLFTRKIQETEPDLLRNLLGEFLKILMSAEADSLCGAEYGKQSADRTNSRNGYRARTFDTRLGTIELGVPKLRHGSYFPDWLLEHRRRAEKALVSVVAESYVIGVSTRRVENLARALGIESLSKSQVSEMAKSLDEMVESFRSRPLDAAPYPYIWVDALYLKCRDGGRVVNLAAVIATGVSAIGQREILGVDLVTSEDGAGWLAFLKGLVARGLNGVKLVISDDHQGLKNAIAATLPGATWQRCRVHYLRNLMTRVPKSAQDLVATLVRSIFAQPSAEEVLAQHSRVVAQLEERFPDAAHHLDEAGPEILAFRSFPKEHWRQIWSNNPQERLNREIRRRTDVVGIFPNRAAAIRLVGAVLAEIHDEWSVSRRYFSSESLAKTIAPPTSATQATGGQQPSLPAAA